MHTCIRPSWCHYHSLFLASVKSRLILLFRSGTSSPWCLQCFDAVGWAAGRASGLKKTEWWGAGVIICLERGADLHMAQLMPRPLTVSCFSKIQIDYTFLVAAHPGSPGQRAVKQACMCVCLCPVLWNCWLGIRKSIWLEKIWVMRCWCGYLSGARCRLFAYGPADATASQNLIVFCLI